MGEEACIDDDLYNKIYDGMMERLKDKVAEIRSQAVTALQRLQDPKDEECPIIRAYLFHLAHDPNNVVRRTIVRCIVATRLTLPHILERTRDTDEHVRRAAYKFLAEKVHIKSLTIEQREGVLGRGLGDRSKAVRRVVEKEMIPGWLRLSNNNIVQLLHHLDVGNSDQGTVEGPMYFFEKNWAKKKNSGIDFRESVRKEKSLLLGIRSLSHD
jgi:condensin complex subunit 3